MAEKPQAKVLVSAAGIADESPRHARLSQPTLPGLDD